MAQKSVCDRCRGTNMTLVSMNCSDVKIARDNTHVQTIEQIMVNLCLDCHYMFATCPNLSENVKYNEKHKSRVFGSY